MRPTLLYTVAFRQDAGAWVTPTWLTNTPLTKTTFTSPIVQLDHTYTFRVTAKDRAGNTGTGTAVTRVEMYRVYLPLTLRSWVWWYANDLYEPNNTPAEAWGPLVSGQSIQAYIWDATDSNDYYHFTPITTGNVVVRLSNIPSGVDYDLYVYWHNGSVYELVKYSNEAGSTPEQASFVGQAGRQYFVRVYPYLRHDSTKPYSLVATYP
ncbi:MAG: hypothetical protein BWY63_02425 [Chloroflexi bacterium ADurb.Bin360]|nr:MAG: hypothetical protein BWY63_02425 [Chloroflexi bacterium ADurb.Bin360]